MRRSLGFLLACAVSACSALPGPGDGGPSDAGGGPADGGGFPPLTQEQATVLAARPYRLVVPTGYDGTAEVPLVVLLHGYTASGQSQDAYFGLSALAQARTFLLATPDGLLDTTLQRYWNATDVCCGSLGTVKADDVFYLTALLDDVRLRYRVDARRVFFVGHSNGGFMSHRMACDRAPRIAAIASLAGALYKDASACRPDAGVAVLQVHGTQDSVVLYDGGTFFGAAAYPGARETVQDWAQLNGCGTSVVSGGANLDVDTQVAGSETTRDRYDGCPGSSAAELWTLEGSGHIPPLAPTFIGQVYDFLLAHSRP